MSSMSKKTWPTVIAGVLLLAAVLRVLYFFEVQDDPAGRSPGLDGAYHDYWARALVSGDWTPPHADADPEIPEHPYFRPPGYPFFLATTYAAGKPGHATGHAAQILIGVFNVLLAFLFARRWFNNVTAILLSLFLAVDWVLLYFEAQLLEPTVLVTLTLAVLYILGALSEKPTAIRGAAAGLLTGLFALVRPNILLFAAAALPWLWWALHRRDRLRSFPAAAAAYALATVLTVSPATIRNYIVAREFVPISANAGINLHFGNNAYSDGYTPSSPGVGAWSCFDYPAVVERVEEETGTSLSYAQTSDLLKKRAWRFALDHPGAALRNTFRKFLLFWGPVEIGNNEEYHFRRTESHILRFLPGAFAQVLALFLLGAGLVILDTRRRAFASPHDSTPPPEITALLLLFVVVYSASFLPFIVAGRYRVPLIPVLLLFGAYAAWRVFSFVKEKSWNRVAAALVIMIALFAVASVNFGGYIPDRARRQYERGLALFRAGFPREGVESFTSAFQLRMQLDREPSNPPALHIPANILQEAVDYYTEALEADPTSVRAHNNLACYLDELGRKDDAIRHLNTALMLNPEYAPARYNLERIGGRR